VSASRMITPAVDVARHVGVGDLHELGQRHVRRADRLGLPVVTRASYAEMSSVLARGTVEGQNVLSAAGGIRRETPLRSSSRYPPAPGRALDAPLPSTSHRYHRADAPPLPRSVGDPRGCVQRIRRLDVSLGHPVCVALPESGCRRTPPVVRRRRGSGRRARRGARSARSAGDGLVARHHVGRRRHPRQLGSARRRPVPNGSRDRRVAAVRRRGAPWRPVWGRAYPSGRAPVQNVTVPDRRRDR
jgi:hypothetical protein